MGEQMAQSVERAGSREGMSAAQWLPLVGMTFLAFVFNTSEFMPVGLLTNIAASFSLSEAAAGIMISVYAWGVMLLSLPLMVAASRFSFKPLLLGVVALFVAGQACSAIAPTFELLTAARLLVAAAHAVFWAIAPVMATRIAGTRHAALALSMIATGTSIASVAGMPLGRAIGLALGWRMTFGCVGVIAAVLLVYQAMVFPQLPAGEPFSLRRLPELLGNRVLVALYVVTMCLATGYYAGYGYIEPFLGQIGGFDAATTTVLLTVFGAAGFVASFLFARFFDGHRYHFVGAMIVGFTAMLFCLQAAAVSLATTVAVCLLWGICGTAFNIALQAMLMDAAPEDDATVAMAIYSGLFNFGIGTGTAIGGVVVSNIALSAIGYAGGAIALVGVVLAIGWLFRLDRGARAARAERK